MIKYFFKIILGRTLYEIREKMQKIDQRFRPIERIRRIYGSIIGRIIFGQDTSPLADLRIVFYSSQLISWEDFIFTRRFICILNHLELDQKKRLITRMSCTLVMSFAVLNVNTGYVVLNIWYKVFYLKNDYFEIACRLSIKMIVN